MKLFYISLEFADKKIGVHDKILGQCKAFAKYNFEVEYIHIFENKLQAKNINTSEIEMLGCIKNILQISFKAYFLILKYINQKVPRIIYLRSNFHDPFLLYFLKYAKNKASIIYEIPTYPYDNEYNKKTFFYRKLLSVDKFFRKFVKKHIKFIVTYTSHSKIFGVKAIKIENGISIEKFRKKKYQPFENKLFILAVANLSNWHGYDRIIEGMKNYYSDTQNTIEVYFNVIGYGTEYYKLKDLIKDSALENYIKFYGVKQSEELDYFFDSAHVGIDVLGMHRRGYNEAASLKAREYCARGLPFVSSVEDSDFKTNFKYVLKIAANDSPVNINEVINFYTTFENSNYINDMHKYAEKNLTWTIKIKSVVAEIHKILK